MQLLSYITALNNRKLFGFSNFYKNFLLFVLIVLISFASILPFKTSLFSGSGWRNTQTFAAYQCFQQAENLKEFARCYFAPKLGFDDKHYVGLEHPVLPLFDYLLDSRVTLDKVKSKTQIISLILIAVSALVFLRFSVFSIGMLSLFYISLMDNPTLNFFALSYQPDLLSMGLIFSGAALACLDKRNVSYIPEIILGLGLMVKPQHGLIGLLAVMFIRYMSVKGNRAVFAVLFKRAFVTVLPVVFFVVSNKISLVTGAGVKYPSLTKIVGGFAEFPLEMIVDYYFQMFSRNGFEYLIITLCLFLLAVYLQKKNSRGYVSFVAYFFLMLLAYTFTYGIFLTGFLANIYYGSVLFISLNLIAIYVLHFFEQMEEGSPLIKAGNIKAVSLIVLLIVAAAAGLNREKEFFVTLLTDRKLVCNPADIRIFAKDIDGNSILINNGALEPTARTAIGKGENVWFTDLNKNYKSYKKRINRGEDLYYFSCSYFTDMMRDNDKAMNFLSRNADEIYTNVEWTVWKLK